MKDLEVKDNDSNLVKALGRDLIQAARSLQVVIDNQALLQFVLSLRKEAAQSLINLVQTVSALSSQLWKQN